MQASRVIKFDCGSHYDFCYEGRASQKKSTDGFLQNGANIATRKEMHDRASYQVLKSSEKTVLNSHSGLI